MTEIKFKRKKIYNKAYYQHQKLMKAAIKTRLNDHTSEITGFFDRIIDKKDGLGKMGVSLIDHKKYKEEEMTITRKLNGRVEFSFSGISIDCPKFVWENRKEFEEQYPSVEEIAANMKKKEAGKV